MDEQKKMLREQVERCRLLPQNWDSYGAEPIPGATVDFALQMLDHLPPGQWHAGPTLDSGIVFEDDQGRTIEVEV